MQGAGGAGSLQRFCEKAPPRKTGSPLKLMTERRRHPMQKELTNAGPLLNERGELCEAG